MEVDRADDRSVDRPDPFDASFAWRAGAISGAVAAAAMGVAISVVRLETLRVAIAGLYGQAGNLGVGWVAHLVHGTLFGILFAGFLSDPALYLVTERRWKCVTARLVYGIVLAVVGAGVVMPIWLEVAGVGSPALLTIDVATPVWHLVYGAVLGSLFPTLEGI